MPLFPVSILNLFATDLMFDQQRHLLKTRCDLDLFGIQWRIVFQILMVLFGFFFICSATIKSLPAIRISRLTSCLKNLHVFHAKGSLVFFASLCHLSLVFISPRMLSVTTIILTSTHTHTLVLNGDIY